MVDTTKPRGSSKPLSPKGDAGAPEINGLGRTGEQVLGDIRNLLIQIFHVGLEPEEPRPSREMVYLLEEVTRVIGSQADPQSLQRMLEMFRCLGREYEIEN